MNISYSALCPCRGSSLEIIVEHTMDHTPIPKEELKLASQLKDIKVVFDVGARTDTDYLELWPDADQHLFEPVPEFFEELKEKVGDRPNIFVNNFGLGDRNEDRGYHNGLQSFVGSWILNDADHRDTVLKLRNTCSYIQEHGIGQIDFFKIDTEGFELKVLLGAIHHFSLIKFIQYEHSGLHNNNCIKGLLNEDFEIYDIGYRNVLCMNRNLVPKEERERLKNYILDNNLKDLV